MYCKYVQRLVEEVRRDTQNAADVPTTASRRGVQDVDILRYLNYAQEDLERLVTEKYPFVFLGTQVFTVTTANSYSVADHIYLDLRIKNVEYSRTGQEADYCKLEYASEEVIFDQETGIPYYWYRTNGNAISLYPKPLGGSIRVKYQRQLDRMAVRVGRVTAATISSGNITAITVDASTDNEAALTAATVLDTREPICVSSPEGIPIAYNINATAYNTGTGVITIAAPLVAPLVATRPPAANDFVTVGRWTTTHSKMPVQAEAYLIESTARKLKIRVTAPQDWKAFEAGARKLAADIAAAYAVADSTAVKPIQLGKYAQYLMRV